MDISLLDYIKKLEARIIKLEAVVENLEGENVETSNCLYEIYNDLDSLKHIKYTDETFTLGDK